MEVNGFNLCIYNCKFLSQALETSLRAWEEKQRNTLSAVTQSASTISNATSQHRPQLQICNKPPQLNDEELNILFNFIEAVTTLVKWVKLLIISHPSLEPDLYQVASRTANALEQVHPDGKILQGVSFNQRLTLETLPQQSTYFHTFPYFFINRLA